MADINNLGHYDWLISKNGYVWLVHVQKWVYQLISKHEIKKCNLFIVSLRASVSYDHWHNNLLISVSNESIQITPFKHDLLITAMSNAKPTSSLIEMLLVKLMSANN